MTNAEGNEGPAERRVAEHLALLRVDPPTAPTALVRRIVRSVRFQRLLRQPLRVAGMIATAAVAGAVALLGLRRRS
jgi:hypothetical protein